MKTEVKYSLVLFCLCFIFIDWNMLFFFLMKQFSINVMLKHLLNINPDDPLASEILENFENYIKGFISLPLNIPGTAYSKALKVLLWSYINKHVILYSTSAKISVLILIWDYPVFGISFFFFFHNNDVLASLSG